MAMGFSRVLLPLRVTQATCVGGQRGAYQQDLFVSHWAASAASSVFPYRMLE
jgi:hypothetical protein